MLHKFRKAAVRPGRTKLVGEVEVDETYVGGPSKKFIVVTAPESYKKKVAGLLGGADAEGFHPVDECRLV